MCSPILPGKGLYRLEIAQNLLTDIPDDAFVGLERSLWELMLPFNELIEVPSRAIRHLQKLRLLGGFFHAVTANSMLKCALPFPQI